MARRAKKKVWVSPKGIAVWPRLWVPDTKFNKMGAYSTKVTFDLQEDDVQAMIEMFKTKMAESFAAAEAERKEADAEARAAKQKLVIKKTKAADPPYVMDEEGSVVQVNYKMTASGVREDGSKWTQRPTGFDAAGVPLTKDLSIGGGSLIRVGYTLDMFSTPAVGAGITLRLKSYQLLTLVKYGGVSFEESGFGVEDGGFDVSDLDEGDVPPFAGGEGERASSEGDEAAPADESQADAPPAEPNDHTADDF